MNTIALILLVFAFVFFVIAACGVATGRINMIGAGLACVTLAQLLGRVALVLVACLLVSGCAIELHADGTKKVQFSPTAADYKAIRNYSR